MSILISPLLVKCLTAGAAALQLACSSAGSGGKSTVKAVGKAQHGIASIYTDHRTATGERFHSGGLTAAHRSYPMGSKVRVTNLRNDQCVIVRINDRGPYTRGRIIDLTPAAASKIGLGRRQGVARVKVERL